MWNLQYIHKISKSEWKIFIPIANLFETYVLIFYTCLRHWLLVCYYVSRHCFGNNLHDNLNGKRKGKKALLKKKRIFSWILYWMAVTSLQRYISPVPPPPLPLNLSDKLTILTANICFPSPLPLSLPLLFPRLPLPLPLLFPLASLYPSPSISLLNFYFFLNPSFCNEHYCVTPSLSAGWNLIILKSTSDLFLAEGLSHPPPPGTTKSSLITFERKNTKYLT